MGWLRPDDQETTSSLAPYFALFDARSPAIDFFYRELVAVGSHYRHYTSYAHLLQSKSFAGANILDRPYELVLNFNGSRFTVALLDPFLRRNYFSLRPGLLIKYMEGRRKGARKTLPTKLLLMRFLRKLFIVSKLDFFEIHVKGVPLHLAQLFNFLNRPLSHTFFDPLSGKTIDETGESHNSFSYKAIYFVRYKPHGYQKTKKRGRIKRKIRRKIISTARVIDEL